MVAALYLFSVIPVILAMSLFDNKVSRKTRLFIAFSWPVTLPLLVYKKYTYS